jgi:hypothetical protein
MDRTTPAIRHPRDRTTLAIRRPRDRTTLAIRHPRESGDPAVTPHRAGAARRRGVTAGFPLARE